MQSVRTRRAGVRAGLTSTRGGWAALLAVTVAKSYLVLVATLAVIAIAPALFGWTASVVQSGSMEPDMSAGDIVVTSPLPDSSPLPVGRVITFHADGRLVVHRLVSVSDDATLVTAGDANAQFDSWSPRRADVTGEARILVPYLGLPSFWLAHGEIAPFLVWAAGTAGALATFALLGPGARRSAARTGRGAGGAPGGRKPSGAIAAGVVVLVALALTTAGPPMVDAAFSATTRTALAMSAKSYPAITTGAMAGYGALAAVSVRDDSGVFENSTVSGSIGTSPGQAVAGYSSRDVSGSIQQNTVAARNAMGSATAAAAALGARDVTATTSPTLSGTLTGGVYTSTSGAYAVPGMLTLDARGDSSARFVFVTTTTLTMAQGARIVLANGAQASNVWWVVGTTATLGGTSTLFGATTTAVGTYLTAGDLVLRKVALTGRAVSITGSVSATNTAITSP